MLICKMKRLSIHPLWTRLTHWLNALAVFVMLLSGWKIYNASPLFDFKFPNGITLGGWLGGALQWHFAAMWLLAFNGIIYLVTAITSGRLRRMMLPITWVAFRQDFIAALRGKLSHDDLASYNTVQKFSYLFAIADLVVLVASGLVLWKPVQFPWLRTLMGDYDVARYVHFFAMGGLAAFIVVHVALALMVPRTLLAMVRGR